MINDEIFNPMDIENPIYQIIKKQYKRNSIIKLIKDYYFKISCGLDVKLKYIYSFI